MRNWTERLIRCGIPEKTAVTIVNFLFKNRRTLELIAYVRLTEEATRPDRNGGRMNERISESDAEPIWLYPADADAAEPAAAAGAAGG